MNAREQILQKRRLTALLLTICLLGAIIFSGRVNLSCATNAICDVKQAIASEKNIEPSDICFQAFMQSFGIAQLDAASLSDEYIEEIGTLPSATEIYASSDNDVVGFIVTGSVEQICAQTKSSLANKGWANTESKTEGVYVATKQEGRYTWALISCTQIGEEVIVVVQT